MFAHGDESWTADYDGVTWYFSVTEYGVDRYATITGATGFTDELEIPSMVFSQDSGMLYVVEIGAAAFKGRTDIKSLDIRSTVREIGDGAFENCTKLAEVYFS